MLRKRIELARRAFDAFSRRDVEAILEITDPEVQFYAATGELSGEEGSNWDDGSYWGHAGIRRYFEDVKRVWAEIDVTPKEFREIGDKLLVLGHVRGRHHGGMVLDAQAQWVWRIRDGKITYWAVYTNLDEALEAIGLSG